MAACYNSEFFRLRIPTGDSGMGEEFASGVGESENKTSVPAGDSGMGEEFASGVGESENKTSVPVDDCVSKVVLLESSLGK